MWHLVLFGYNMAHNVRWNPTAFSGEPQELAQFTNNHPI